MQTNTRGKNNIIIGNHHNAARSQMSTDTHNNNKKNANHNNDNDPDETKNTMVTMLVTCAG